MDDDTVVILEYKDARYIHVDHLLTWMQQTADAQPEEVKELPFFEGARNALEVFAGQVRTLVNEAGR